MKVIYGDNDNRDCSNTKRYAYLNWWFDNGFGENQDPYQHIFDNFTLGKAFLGNALLSLNDIFECKNYLNVADVLIFPILFNSWHGLELWFKSSISAMTLLTAGNDIRKTGHKIPELSRELRFLLQKNNCKSIISIAMASTENLVAEFEKVNANFDFARYSFDVKGNYQFYNAPYNSDKQWQSPNKRVLQNIVPNTCVDIGCLLKILADVFQNFGSFVDYLTLCIREGGIVSDEDYQCYLTAMERSEESFKKYDSQEAPIRDIIVKAIMS